MAFSAERGLELIGDVLDVNVAVAKVFVGQRPISCYVFVGDELDRPFRIDPFICYHALDLFAKG